MSRFLVTFNLGHFRLTIAKGYGRFGIKGGRHLGSFGLGLVCGSWQTFSRDFEYPPGWSIRRRPW